MSKFFPWNDAQESPLELAEACDVPVQWSCRSGVCHTCELVLMSGTVNYPPDPVEPPPRATSSSAAPSPQEGLSWTSDDGPAAPGPLPKWPIWPRVAVRHVKATTCHRVHRRPHLCPVLALDRDPYKSVRATFGLGRRNMALRPDQQTRSSLRITGITAEIGKISPWLLLTE
ncbi:2Fe-2S iron-sulfur cluster-binding protein [Streptomyces sp. NPDC056910]|uniref:2Fe-2S iron-sulfur cluster-binding protein n=1 Tax=Streptomyces sp. NPDC056910 TaxID=3345964 RepID=UPI003683B810